MKTHRGVSLIKTHSWLHTGQSVVPVWWSLEPINCYYVTNTLRPNACGDRFTLPREEEANNGDSLFSVRTGRRLERHYALINKTESCVLVPFIHCRCNKTVLRRH